ncbi:unnamed protein product [Microthlaspi erraticum]|uniref:J domain-containing protein n=1 Tax=Microthlaspi erraticum TaxID=1685480 RepID=A0A6D2JBN7_9BRAS|nr:unnamed protein product [Microthlaspi erraticum]
MMESDKEEARRALETAERKLSENDYNGAREFVWKAHKLYPELVGLEQVLMITHVYMCGSDWYGILGVDPLADDETVKRQYKKLALSLHPDKNRFHGAEGAFKLVSDAWCLLSDKPKRLAYDRTRRWKESYQKKSDWPKNEPASSSFSPSSTSAYHHQAQERWKQWGKKLREDTKPQKEQASSTSASFDYAKAAERSQERWEQCLKNQEKMSMQQRRNSNILHQKKGKSNIKREEELKQNKIEEEEDEMNITIEEEEMMF